MLRAMGIDPATDLFKAAGAPLMAALLQALGPQFNAVLVSGVGKGALLLLLDLGAGFLAEVGACAATVALHLAGLACSSHCC
jgi:hypothetical protein